jgi:SAM-dependent methyltransferase
MQKHITGRYLLTVDDALLEVFGFHLKNFSGGIAIEFGAGTDLLCPLLLSNAGAREVIALDLTRLASADRVNNVIRQLRGKLPGEWPEISDVDGDLFAKYRIRYMAPGDARATGLADASVDMVCSTSTLEHIPENAIRSILKEARRILKPTGVASFIIDYHDHYASGDRSISRFNFYRYGHALWRIFNPGMHYQNRLRHSDFLKLFDGFSVTESAIVPPDQIDVPLAAPFKHYGARDLLALNGFFTLKP